MLCLRVRTEKGVSQMWSRNYRRDEILPGVWRSSSEEMPEMRHGI